jgi:hypothetical protein
MFVAFLDSLSAKVTRTLNGITLRSLTTLAQCAPRSKTWLRMCRMAYKCSLQFSECSLHRNTSLYLNGVTSQVYTYSTTYTSLTSRLPISLSTISMPVKLGYLALKSASRSCAASPVSKLLVP